MHFGGQSPARAGHESHRRSGLTAPAESDSEPPGLRVAVTRARNDSGEEPLSSLFRARHARPVHYPLTQTVPPPDPGKLVSAAAAILDFDWLVVTSARTIEPLLAALSVVGQSPSDLSHARIGICAVGPVTARALREVGLPVHLVPDRFDSEGVVAALREQGDLPGTRILFPRALEGKETIPRELAASGATVEVVPAYETIADPEQAIRLATDVEAGAVDLLTFTAASAARTFGEAWSGRGPIPGGTGVLALGPATASALAAVGIPADLVADRHTLEGLVDAAEAWAGSRAGGR